jgi:hypothetical protein
VDFNIGITVANSYGTNAPPTLFLRGVEKGVQGVKYLALPEGSNRIQGFGYLYLR